MDSKQTLELVVIWQEVNDGLDRIQAILAGDGHNGFIQELETWREGLDDIVDQATNGDATWPLLVDEEPDWGGVIPFGGEVSPDEVKAKEPGIPLADERFTQRQLDMARKTGLGPMGWK